MVAADPAAANTKVHFPTQVTDSEILFEELVFIFYVYGLFKNAIARFITLCFPIYFLKNVSLVPYNFNRLSNIYLPNFAAS